MATQLPPEETVTVEDVLISQSFEIAALVTILERKGLLREKHLYQVLKKWLLLYLLRLVKRSELM
jgi:hypothetical protein